MKPYKRATVQLGSALLTPRERQVLELVETGETYGTIAARLGISEATVSTHMVHAREKGVSIARAKVAYKQLYQERPKTVAPGRALKQCMNCGMWFSMPTCHADKHNSCSAACGIAIARAPKEARKRECLHCGKPFIPRTAQVRAATGKYCSQACNGKARLGTPHPNPRPRQSDEERRRKIREYSARPEVKERQTAKQREKWAKNAEIYREKMRGYRKANPHKTREWYQNRRARSAGKRLPKGTLSRLFEAQRGKCAICRNKLGERYHTDHIVPLARGGKHEKHNIQLLCGPCNCRKSAKDPIQYMQERGFLL